MSSRGLMHNQHQKYNIHFIMQCYIIIVIFLQCFEIVLNNVLISLQLYITFNT